MGMNMPGMGAGIPGMGGMGMGAGMGGAQGFDPAAITSMVNNPMMMQMMSQMMAVSTE
jgi:hypothetical protein